MFAYSDVKGDQSHSEMLNEELKLFALLSPDLLESPQIRFGVLLASLYRIHVEHGVLAHVAVHSNGVATHEPLALLLNTSKVGVFLSTRQTRSVSTVVGIIQITSTTTSDLIKRVSEMLRPVSCLGSNAQ